MGISEILAANEDAVFAAVGEDATYTPSGGAATAIRVIPVQPDEVVGLEGMTTRTRARTAVFHVRVSEVSAPAEGASLVHGGSSYTIKGAPRTMDARRRIWTIETVPA